jgi:hypothetical protein
MQEVYTGENVCERYIPARNMYRARLWCILARIYVRARPRYILARMLCIGCIGRDCGIYRQPTRKIVQLMARYVYAGENVVTVVYTGENVCKRYIPARIYV